MLHIYRQIKALQRVRPVVIAQKREHAERFPCAPVHVVGKPATHFRRRIWFRQIRDVPWQISRGEVSALQRVIVAEGAELLHVYFGHIAVHLLPLIRARKGPTVVSFHGADVMVELEKPAYRAATKEMLDAAQLVLVRSRSLANALIELGCPEPKIRMQRTGIPLDEFPFRARVWPLDHAWRLVQACRLIEKKGLRTSLRAFAQFAARYPQARFTIAGDGPLQVELEVEVQTLGLAHAVTFTGFMEQEKLRELFYASHLFLHPSEIGRDGNQEGVPNSMLEAMASGLPVFATKHGGIPEVIEDGKTGVLVDERDEDALAANLLRAAEATDLLDDVAVRATQFVTENFELHAQARKLEEIYFEAIDAKKSSS